MEQVNKKQADIVLKTIKRLEKQSGQVSTSDLRKELKNKDMTLSDMNEAIKLLRQSGDIYKPKEGLLKTI